MAPVEPPVASSAEGLQQSEDHAGTDARRGPGDGGRPDRRPFRVQVAALRKQNGTTRQEHRSGPIADLGAVSVTVPDTEDVTCDLTLTSFPGGITVTGQVRAPWVGECRRCGGSVEGMAMAEVREHYAPAGGKIGDEEAYPLVGDDIDLEPLARDAVLLSLPLAPLCDADCQGLCPSCGANRNMDACACEAPLDPRWAALDTLRDEGPPT